MKPLSCAAAVLAIAAGFFACGGGNRKASAEEAKSAAPKNDKVKTASAEASLHPAFDLSAAAFADLLSGASLPDKAAAAISGDPAGFLDLLARVLPERRDLLRLVDKRHLLPRDYAPADLVDLRALGVLTSRPGLKLREKAARALADMAKAARAEGVTLLASSAYRSYDYQKTVYERNVKELGQAAADRESARPGASQHQLGTAVDFGSIDDSFEATQAAAWLSRRASEFGFSLSFPKGYEEVTGYRHESWHYRCLGREAALMEKKYFGGIQQHFLEFLDGRSEAFERVLRKRTSP